MGLYSVACPRCSEIHLWHSSSLDQRCSKCIGADMMFQSVSHRLVRTIKLALDTLHQPSFLQALEQID